MPKRMRATLAQGSAAFEVPLDETQMEQLGAYAALIEKWNKSFNLISRRDIDRLASRHLVDSLSGVPFLPSEASRRVLDVGSGAGLPGVVLAIAAPHLSFTLCDRNARRVRFLQQVIRALALPNVEAIETDLQPGTTWRPGGDEPQLFAAVVARAVQPADSLWSLVRHLLAPEGELLVYESVIMPTPPPDGSQDLAATSDKEGSLAADALEFGDDVAVTRHTYNIPGLEPVHTLLRVRAVAP